MGPFIGSLNGIKMRGFCFTSRPVRCRLRNLLAVFFLALICVIRYVYEFIIHDLSEIRQETSCHLGCRWNTPQQWANDPQPTFEFNIKTRTLK